ncbi:MAG: two-component system sensor histidine kinase NtrB [Terriglobales bacterium]
MPPSPAVTAEARARLLLEATDEGIYELDNEGRCVWSNSAAARILGYPGPEEYVGRSMHALLHHTRPDGTAFPESECPAIKKLRAGERTVQPQELLWRADGSSFWAEVRVNPIVCDGTVRGGVVVLRDVSERLRQEEQYRQALKMETVGRLAAGVAHDFNNLLTVINGYAQLLLETPGLEETVRGRLHAIAQAGGRAAALTQELLDFSRQEKPAFHALPLNELVCSVQPLLRTMLGEDIELALELTPELPAVHGDDAQIEQAVMNLAVNARDAMSGHGRLTLRSASVDMGAAAARRLGVTKGRYVTLTIADTGSGMSADTQQRIFEPFFTTKPPSQGTGLGLSRVQAVVQQCGGAIAVTSTLGEGTTVMLYFPAAAATAAAAGSSGSGR